MQTQLLITFLIPVLSKITRSQPCLSTLSDWLPSVRQDWRLVIPAELGLLVHVPLLDPKYSRGASWRRKGLFQLSDLERTDQEKGPPSLVSVKTGHDRCRGMITWWARRQRDREREQWGPTWPHIITNPLGRATSPGHTLCDLNIWDPPLRCPC